MSGGLSLWVPIVSAIGSLGLGAFVGALVAHWLQARTERQRANSERDGLLRLLLHEMRFNAGMCLSFKHNPGLFTAGNLEPLRSDVWEDVRVRLADLLKYEDFVHLATYYSYLQAAKISLESFQAAHHRKYDEDRWSESTKAHMEILLDEVDVADAVARRILGRRAEDSSA
jgi:hypothetical protein